MIVGSDDPSSKPSPLLHFTLDPLWHKLDARTKANKSCALTYAHVSAYDLSHLAAMLVATYFRKCSASVEKPINICHKRSKCSSPYLPLPLYIASSFSRALDSKIDSGVRFRCDGASVSMTNIYNNASTWEKSKHLECLDRPSILNHLIGRQPL